MDSNFLEKYNSGQTILVDKELDWTSFDVIKKLRNLIKCKKIGHAGTLDPLATGLLIICTGKNTKKINDYQNLTKTYTGDFTIGNTTPSHDMETDINSSCSFNKIKKTDVINSSKSFIGKQMQRPPKFSAVKVRGKRAYELARKKEDIFLDEKEIEIKSFSIKNIALPIISFEIICSKGTYIRSIARDFGKSLGCGAYLSKLRRTHIGNFSVDNAYRIDKLVEKIKKEKIENN